MARGRRFADGGAALRRWVLSEVSLLPGLPQRAVKNSVSNVRSNPLPDPERCVAEPMAGVDEIAFCRVDEGYLCQHVLPFGDEHFCRHPERKRFVVRVLERA